MPFTKVLFEQAQKYHVPILIGEAPPEWKPGNLAHHDASPQIYEMMAAFIAGVANLRDSNNGVIPEAEKWQCSAMVDGIIQHYPSEQFRQLWLKLPHETAASLRAYDGDLLTYPPLDEPKGIVFLIYDQSISNNLLLEDAMYCLNQNHNVVYAMKTGDYPYNDLQIAPKHLQTILQNEKYQSLPVMLIGNEVGGNIAALTASQAGSARIEKVITWDSDADCFFTEASFSDDLPLPPEMKLVMYYYSIAPEIKLSIAEHFNAEDTGNLERDWFTFLEAVVK